jgi:hypothetical protein
MGVRLSGREPRHLLEVEVGGRDPYTFTLIENSIQLLTMTNAVREFVVQEHCRAVVYADLVERMSSEVLGTHDLIVGVLVDCFLHPLEIALELSLRCLPGTLEQVLAVSGVDGAAVGRSPHRAFPATVESSSSNVA